MATNHLVTIFEKYEVELLEAWSQSLGTQFNRLGPSDASLRNQHCDQFLNLLADAVKKDESHNIERAHWSDLRAFLAEFSQARAREGFSPRETAMFIFLLKQPLFTRLNTELHQQPAELAEATWSISTLLDKLGLYTMEVYQRTREVIISRQHEELLELSTPVVKLWHNILMLPLIGTLDSARTQVVMESLLERLADAEAYIAIIDISGVPTVDTLVAQHLLKTIAAARLMGADCIISGIRPQIAQTIVHLGVDLGDVVTKSSLADAFTLALKMTNSSIIPKSTDT